MYPTYSPPKPLPQATFYILLVLYGREMHAYAIGAAAHNASLGSVKFPDDKLYPLIHKLHDEGMIDFVSVSPAGPSGTPRKHYALGKYGQIRLHEEVLRLTHAYRIAEQAGLTERPETPFDIQRLLLGL